jgi:hypothetical protein
MPGPFSQVPTDEWDHGVVLDREIRFECRAFHGVVDGVREVELRLAYVVRDPRSRSRTSQIPAQVPEADSCAPVPLRNEAYPLPHLDVHRLPGESVVTVRIVVFEIHGDFLGLFQLLGHFGERFGRVDQLLRTRTSTK